MQIIPPAPLPTKTTTVKIKIKAKQKHSHQVMSKLSFVWMSARNSHKIGNFPTLLIKMPITANPIAYNDSKTIPCSNVANSNFVTQIFSREKNN